MARVACGASIPTAFSFTTPSMTVPKPNFYPPLLYSMRSAEITNEGCSFSLRTLTHHIRRKHQLDAVRLQPWDFRSQCRDRSRPWMSDRYRESVANRVARGQL